MGTGESYDCKKFSFVHRPVEQFRLLVQVGRGINRIRIAIEARIDRFQGFPEDRKVFLQRRGRILSGSSSVSIRCFLCQCAYGQYQGNKQIDEFHGSYCTV